MAKSSGGTRTSGKINNPTKLTSSQVDQLKKDWDYYDEVTEFYIQKEKDLYPETIQLWKYAKKIAKEIYSPNSDISEKSVKAKVSYIRKKGKQILKSNGDFEKEKYEVERLFDFDETPNHRVIKQIIQYLNDAWYKGNKTKGKNVKYRYWNTTIKNDLINY